MKTILRTTVLSLLACATAALGLSASPPQSAHASKTDVLALVNALPVAPRTPGAKNSYKGNRVKLFGTPWTDNNDDPTYGHNHCDTRNDILRRDMKNVTNTPKKPCKVRSGTLIDPYSGERIQFLSDTSQDSAKVQIDHIVPLSLAWQTGADRLTQRQRIDLANDPINLLSVKGSLNQQKSDSSIDAWVPPNTAIRCWYASEITYVKTKYHLWVTAPEKAALLRYVNQCPN